MFCAGGGKARGAFARPFETFSEMSKRCTASVRRDLASGHQVVLFVFQTLKQQVPPARTRRSDQWRDSVFQVPRY